MSVVAVSFKKKHARQRAHGAKYLLQGLICCHNCGYAYYGRAMNLKSGKNKERHDAYYCFFSSRRRHTRSLRDWSSDVCSSDLARDIGCSGFATESTVEPVEP